MHYLYILQNKSGRSYTGVTQNVERRILQHNSGRVTSTKHGRQWYVVHIETFETLSEAKKREWFIKCTPQGGKLKKKFLETAGIPATKA